MSPLPAGWWVGRRIRRLTALGQRKIGYALDAIERAEQISAAFHDLTASRAEVRLPPPPTPRRSQLRFVAVGLTLLNAAAVVLVLTVPDASSADTDGSAIGIAVLLGFLLAVAQLTLAAALGSKLQASRQTAAPPSLRAHNVLPERTIPFEAAALGLLSTLVAWVIYLWTQIRIADNHPSLAVTLGIGLALQAWTAPWLLVADVADTRPTTHRSIAVLDRHLEQLANAWEVERGAASLALLTARSALHKSERSLTRNIEIAHRPTRASWSHSLRQLDEAITSTQARYLALTAADKHNRPFDEPPDRGNVDLVG